MKLQVNAFCLFDLDGSETGDLKFVLIDHLEFGQQEVTEF